MWWGLAAKAKYEPPDPLLSAMRRALLGLRDEHELMDWIGLTDERMLMLAAEKATEVARKWMDQ